MWRGCEEGVLLRLIRHLSAWGRFLNKVVTRGFRGGIGVSTSAVWGWFLGVGGMQWSAVFVSEPTWGLRCMGLIRKQTWKKEMRMGGGVMMLGDNEPREQIQLKRSALQHG